MIEIKLNFASIALALAFLEASNAVSKPVSAETAQPDSKPGKSVDTPKAADATAKPTAKADGAAPKTPPPESSALTYEVVGAAISKAVTDPANKPAVKALLGEFDAKDGSGKATNGQKLKPEDYPAFMEKLAAIGEDLG